MFFRDLTRIDRRLLFGSTMVLAVALLLLVFDGWLYQMNPAGVGTRIGKIIVSKNDVRRRFDSRFSWSPLSEGQEVFSGDRIFTGPQSEAIILTADGSEIIIAPNSFVVIKTREDSLYLDIDFGSIQGKLEKDSQILIGSGEQVTRLTSDGENSVIKVDVAENKDLLVNVLEGQAQINSKDQQRIVGEDQGAEVLKDGQLAELEKAEISLQGTLVNKIVSLETKRRVPLLFQWKSSVKFPTYSLQVARDANFQDIILDENVPYESFENNDLPLDRRLYWRVQAEVKERGILKSSPTAYFLLTTNTAPDLIFPAPKQILRYSIQEGAPEGLHLLMRWAPQTPSQTWEVQVSKDPNFGPGTDSYIAQKNEVLTERMPQGLYYWRVHGKDFENLKWSSTGAFKLERSGTSLIAAPVIESNMKRIELDSRVQNLEHAAVQQMADSEIPATINNIPELDWKSQDPSASYRLQISKDKDFKKLVVDKTTFSDKFQWDSALPGEYFWRIQSVAGGQLSAPTPARKMEVGVKPPDNKTESEVIEEIPDLALMANPPAPVSLKWTPTIKTGGYEVEFDQDPNFSKPLKVKVADNKTQVKVPQAGQYFWRVRSMGENNKAISNYSPTYPLNLNRVFKNPESTRAFRTVFPKQNDTLIVVGKGKNSTRFQWTTPFNQGTKYEMQLAADKDFKDILFNSKTDGGLVKYSKDLPSGWLYWRLRAVTKEFASPWLPPTRFQVMIEQKNRMPTGIGIDPGKAQAMTQSTAPDFAANAPGVAAFKSSGPKGPALPTPKVAGGAETIQLKGKGDTGNVWTSLAALKNTQEYKTLDNAPLLKWNEVPDADNYIIEISRSPTFAPLLIRQDTNRNEFPWKNVTPGTYYWRVASSSVSRAQSPWSQAGKIVVQVTNPRSLTARTQTTWYENEREPLKPFDLEWTPVPYAAMYEIEFAKDLSLEVKRTFIVKSSFKRVSVSQPGKYFWRVRAKDADNQILSDFTPLESVEVLKLPRPLKANVNIQGTFPADGFTFELEGTNGGYIPFEWSSTKSEPGVYTVEIADNKEFKSPIASERADQTRANVFGNWDSKQYFWRVGWQSISGGQTVWSNPRLFNVNFTRRPASLPKPAPGTIQEPEPVNPFEDKSISEPMDL